VTTSGKVLPEPSAEVCKDKPTPSLMRKVIRKPRAIFTSLPPSHDAVAASRKCTPPTLTQGDSRGQGPGGGVIAKSGKGWECKKEGGGMKLQDKIRLALPHATRSGGFPFLTKKNFKRAQRR